MPERDLARGLDSALGASFPRIPHYCTHPDEATEDAPYLSFIPHRVGPSYEAPSYIRTNCLVHSTFFFFLLLLFHSSFFIMLIRHSLKQTYRNGAGACLAAARHYSSLPLTVPIKLPNGTSYEQPTGLFINNEFVHPVQKKSFEVISSY